MLITRIASRAASACRSRAALAAGAYRSRAALTARHLSDAAAKQHERALEALDAGAPPEAVVPLFEAAAAEGHAEATFFVGLAKAGLLEPDDGTVAHNCCEMREITRCERWPVFFLSGELAP